MIRTGTGRVPWLLAALLAALLALTFLMPHLRPLFAALFPGIDPVFTQDDFPALLLGHLEIVAAASLAATLVGTAAGIAVTRPAGAGFRPVVETLAAIGQTVPPVAVLALSVPAIGFGAAPAILALALYGLLPIIRNTITGLDATPATTLTAARGMGMAPHQILYRVELPLAAPIILGGIRVSVAVGTGTAAIASTVGARTLGLPIVVGLNGANTAFVVQGALLVALLALTLDQALDQFTRCVSAWRTR